MSAIETPRQDSDFRTWEWTLIILALVLLAGSTVVYLSGISLRKYILGWDDGEGSEQVGLLAKQSGKVRRQLELESEFKAIDPSALLYNYDTVMTSSDGGAILQIDDGSTIELGPNTMVRLAFDRRLGAGRSTIVEVAIGEVTGVAKSNSLTLRSGSTIIPIARNGRQSISIGVKPKPSPVAAAETETGTEVKAPTLHVRLVEPKLGARLRIEDPSTLPRRPVTLKWEVLPLDTQLTVILKKTGSMGELVSQTVTPQGGKGSVTAQLQGPGTYEWELQAADGKPLELKTPTKSKFFLDPEFVAIETLPPLVGGMKASSNAYQGKLLNKFDITLRWKPYQGATAYTVRVTDKRDSNKALIERRVQKTEYLFNKDKIFSGQVYYKVLVPLASGFVAASAPQLFMFNFLPPLLVIPEDAAVMSRAQLASGDNSILMTWQKTNFTIGYEIEIATDANFTQGFMKKTVKENFFVLSSVPPGSYWWRVRSFTSEISSPFSMPNVLKITP